MAGDPISFPLLPRSRNTSGSIVLLRPGAPRLRRTDEPPADIHHELEDAFHRAYPRSLRAGDGLWLRYRVGQMWRLDEDGPVATREVTCWLCGGGERLGMLTFREWDVWPDTENDDFLMDMDAESFAASVFSEVVAGAWSVRALADCGPLLEFARLWVHPAHAKGSLWLPAVRALLRRRYEGRFSVMVLKAFPIEYEGEVPDGSPLELAFDRRQRAAKRLFVRRLGVRPFPGEPGAEGWMWRPLRDGVPEPDA